MKNLSRYSVLLARGFAAGRALRSSALWSGVGCLAIGSLLSGCNVLPEQQADPVRHFTLSGPAGTSTVADAVTVRPVQLAGHLRNRSMAVRVSENEVIYLDDVRWAEPLDEAITQVLRNRLRTVGGGASVAVQVQRCELVRSEGNTVQLAATYTVTSPGGPAHSGSFVAGPRTWDGRDHGALVGLLREAVTELAEAISVAAERK
jgi:uncharacterized lipoprotein YmbA